MPIFKTNVTIGDQIIEIQDEFKTQKELMEKLSFYTAFPKEGPTGNKDLKVVYRFIQNKYQYYSIRDEKAGMELHLGIYNDGSNNLFVKDWAPIYGDDKGQETISAPIIPTPSAAPVIPTPAPSKPAPTPVMPTPVIPNPSAVSYTPAPTQSGLSDSSKAKIDAILKARNINK